MFPIALRIARTQHTITKGTHFDSAAYPFSVQGRRIRSYDATYIFSLHLRMAFAIALCEICVGDVTVRIPIGNLLLLSVDESARDFRIHIMYKIYVCHVCVCVCVNVFRAIISRKMAQ